MNLQDAIKQGKAQRVAVSILDAGGQVHEKYVISVKVASLAVAGFTHPMAKGQLGHYQKLGAPYNMKGSNA